MSMNVKKNDTVVVLSGKDKGKQGKVLSVDPKSSKAIVEKVNVASRHQKPRRQGDEGGIVQKETPIYTSKLMTVCPKCNKPTAEVAPALMQKFGYRSIMEIPKVDKIVVNCGCGEARDNAKVLESVLNDLATITGQKPVVTKAKKSVANFKLREGMPIGAKVTLRQDKMWEFMDRLFNVALPRVRDFRGINPNAFDGRGNYALGLKEQLIFPEIEYDQIDKIRGMDVVICTTAKTDEEAKELLSLLGAPFTTNG